MSHWKQTLWVKTTRPEPFLLQKAKTLAHSGVSPSPRAAASHSKAAEQTGEMHLRPGLGPG